MKIPACFMLLVVHKWEAQSIRSSNSVQPFMIQLITSSPLNSSKCSVACLRDFDDGSEIASLESGLLSFRDHQECSLIFKRN